MKLSILLFISCCVAYAAGNGVRGAWERVFFYYAYLAEEQAEPIEGQARQVYKIAPDCVGTRGNDRCTAFEFLKHIWEATPGYEELSPEILQDNKVKIVTAMNKKVSEIIAAARPGLSSPDANVRAAAKTAMNKAVDEAKTSAHKDAAWTAGEKYQQARALEKSKFYDITTIEPKEFASNIQSGQWTFSTNAKELYPPPKDVVAGDDYWYHVVSKIGDVVATAKAGTPAPFTQAVSRIFDRAQSAADTARLYRWQDMEKFRLSETMMKKGPVPPGQPPASAPMVDDPDQKHPFALLKRDPAFKAAMDAAGSQLFNTFHLSKDIGPSLPGDGFQQWFKYNSVKTKTAYSMVHGFGDMLDKAFKVYSQEENPKKHYMAIASIESSVKAMAPGAAPAGDVGCS